MRVAHFTDEYEAAAAVLGRPAAEQRARDDARPGPLRRWLAWDGDEVVAAVTATTRPDRRTFVSFAGPHRAWPALVDAAGAAVATLHALARDPEALAALAASGFAVEMEAEEFRVRFDAALAALRRVSMPRGFTLVRAADADPERLFALDNAVRQDVPGTDGWEGDRTMFLDELSDPAAYLVAVEEASGAYVGLARVWRNPAGPRFGLVGVARRHRGTMVGPALIKAVLEEAAQWGHGSFTTETSLGNDAVHPRLARLAAARLGRFAQLIRPA